MCTIHFANYKTSLIFLIAHLLYKRSSHRECGFLLSYYGQACLKVAFGRLNMLFFVV